MLRLDQNMHVANKMITQYSHCAHDEDDGIAYHFERYICS